jgi:hypothetical protein
MAPSAIDAKAAERCASIVVCDCTQPAAARAVGVYAPR